MSALLIECETPQAEHFSLIHNPLSSPTAPWSTAQDAILNDAGLTRARETIASWPGYLPTPLHPLPALASQLGISGLYYKDEASRFGLGSFKALGGAYAVARLLQKEIASRTEGEEPDIQAILYKRHVQTVSEVTVCCATDGNHGRSVAWGAQKFGCQCVIFIHATVSEGRKLAIEQYGAKVIRTSGNYDDSVREAQQAASDNGWYVVSDTSYPGYVEIPKDVMQGYELMVAEADEQLPEKPTHVIIQTGVGGVAAAVGGYYARRYGHKRPAIILADPARSACWLETVQAGTPTPVTGDLDTMMAGLACGEVSLLAWTILQVHADVVVAVPDEGVAPMMKILANPLGSDPVLVAGESAVAGLLALSLARQVPEACDALCLTPDARVLVFGTEGDTDPELYEQIVGVTGDSVRDHASHLPRN